jgi:DNA-binding transcriptional LysR family regulator
MRHLNLDQVDTLLTVIDLGSFSAAARKLNLSQPAVSQQVKELEARLGVPLIERLGKRAHATAAVADVLVRARRLLQESEQIVAAARRHDDASIGRVRIGTATAVCVYLLPSVLGKVRAAYPGIEITIDIATTDAVVARIASNDLDLGLVTVPVQASAVLDVTPIRSDPMMAVLPKRTLRVPRKVTPAFLAGHPLIFNEPPSRMHRLTLAWFAAAGVSPKPIVELGNSEAIKALVAAGLGAAVLPIERANDPLLAGRAILRDLDPPLTRELALVKRRDKRLSRSQAVVHYALLALRNAAGRR